MPFFRLTDYKLEKSQKLFKDSFVISGFVPLQQNDRLRAKAEILNVVFRPDEYKNIIVITAYSKNGNEISIFLVVGKLVLQQTIKSTVNEININTLQSGLYTI